MRKRPDTKHTRDPSPSRSVPTRRFLPPVVLVLMACVYATLAVSSLRQESVTVDEFGHLPVGYNVLTTGDFRYCTLNPPLMNVLCAVPLLAMDLPAGRAGRDSEDPYSFWANGYSFMADHSSRYHGIFVAARYVTVGAVGLLGLLVFGWARILAPERPNLAGLLAAALIWFSPTMLAHARLVTTDAGAAFFITLALFSLHLFLRRPGFLRALGVGLALGLAQLVKFSAIYLYPVFAILILAWAFGIRRGMGRRTILWSVLAFAVSLVVINAGYLFHDTMRPLGGYRFVSNPFLSTQAVLPDRLPIPLPESFVAAFDRQVRDAEKGDPSYLFGTTYRGNKWFFFVALLAVKTPIPLLAVAGLAVAIGVFRRTIRLADAMLLLLPAAVLLIVFSLFSNKQLGLRMILPAAPLFWLWAASTLARAPWPRPAVWTFAVLLGWLGVETLRIHPDYLAYFNPFVGGPSQGYRYAVDSNLDWGQDLPKLKRYMDDNHISSIQLLYFGRVDPAIYGLTYEVPRESLHPGYLAVSATMYTRPYFVCDHGQVIPGGPISPSMLPRPIASVGHSIYIYRLSPPPSSPPTR
jgi:hypothetical protein